MWRKTGRKTFVIAQAILVHYSILTWNAPYARRSNVRLVISSSITSLHVWHRKVCGPHLDMQKKEIFRYFQSESQGFSPLLHLQSRPSSCFCEFTFSNILYNSLSYVWSYFGHVSVLLSCTRPYLFFKVGLKSDKRVRLLSEVTTLQFSRSYGSVGRKSDRKSVRRSSFGCQISVLLSRKGMTSIWRMSDFHPTFSISRTEIWRKCQTFVMGYSYPWCQTFVQLFLTRLAYVASFSVWGSVFIHKTSHEFDIERRMFAIHRSPEATVIITTGRVKAFHS